MLNVEQISTWNVNKSAACIESSGKVVMKINSENYLEEVNCSIDLD